MQRVSEEASDGESKKRGIGFLFLAVLPVLYVLSTGPVIKLAAGQCRSSLFKLLMADEFGFSTLEYIGPTADSSRKWCSCCSHWSLRGSLADASRELDPVPGR